MFGLFSMFKKSTYKSQYENIEAITKTLKPIQILFYNSEVSIDDLNDLIYPLLESKQESKKVEQYLNNQEYTDDQGLKEADIIHLAPTKAIIDKLNHLALQACINKTNILFDLNYSNNIGSFAQKNYNKIITFLYHNNSQNTFNLLKSNNQKYSFYLNNGNVFVTPKNITNILNIMHFAFFIFKSTLTWHLEIIKKHSIELNIISSLNKFEQDKNFEYFYTLQKSTIELINNTIDIFNTKYKTLYPIINFISRSILSMYINHYNYTKCQLFIKYQNWLEFNAKNKVVNLNLINQIYSLQKLYIDFHLSNNDKNNISIIIQTQQNKLIESLFSSLLSAGEKAEEEFLKIKKTNKILLELTKSNLNKNITKVIDCVESQYDLNVIEPILDDIITAYQQYGENDYYNLKVHLLKSIEIKNKLNCHELMTNITIFEEELPSELLIGAPYWRQIDYNNQQPSSENWLNYTTKLALSSYPKNSMTCYELHTMANQCLTKRPELFNLANYLFQASWLNLIKDNFLNNKVCVDTIRLSEFMFINLTTCAINKSKKQISKFLQDKLYTITWDQNSAELIKQFNQENWYEFLILNFQKNIDCNNTNFNNYFQSLLATRTPLFGENNQYINQLQKILNNAIIQNILYQTKINFDFLSYLLNNNFFVKSYLDNSSINLDINIQSIIKLESITRKLSITDLNTQWEDFHDLLIKFNTLINTNNTLLQKYKNILLKRSFITISNQIRAWLLNNEIELIITKLSNLEKTLTAIKNTEQNTNFDKIYQPWFIIIENKALVSTVSDKILDSIRENDFKFLDNNKFYCAILELKLYEDYVHQCLQTNIQYKKSMHLDSTYILKIEKILSSTIDNEPPKYETIMRNHQVENTTLTI